MHPVSEATAAMAAVLKSVADVNPTFMSTAEKATALSELSVLEGQVAELRLRVMASSSAVAAEGADRDVASWLARTQRLRRSDCAADLRLANALDRDRACLAQAVRDGDVNLSQARVIAAAVDDLPARVGPEIRERAEAALVGYAQEFDPAQLARLGRRILDVVAPEVAEAEEARRLAQMEAHAQEKQRLRMRALGDGTTRLSAVLPDATAARLATYLHAFSSPRRDGGEPRTQVDDGAGPSTRWPYPRRLAEAFGQLLECLDPKRLPIHGGDATTLTVTVSLDALRAELSSAAIDSDLPGDGLDAITAAQARRLACTAKIVPAVLGSESEVLDLGRSRRLFSSAQRKALLLRDGRCRAQGCDVPGTWSEAHHLTAWQDGGGTDLSNSVLLCSHHHHRIHDPGYGHRRLPDGDIELRRRPSLALAG